YRGIFSAARPGLPAHRIAARGDVLLRVQRRIAEAVPREVPRAVVCQSAGASSAVRKPAGGGRGGVHWHAGHRAGRDRPLMTLPPKLEAKFQQLLGRYPVKRSALVPMLMYAQDQYGCVSDEMIAEIARRL